VARHRGVQPCLRGDAGALSRKQAEHGTPSGYNKHRKDGTPVCVACAAAVAADRRQRVGGKPAKPAEWYYEQLNHLVEARGWTLLEPEYLGASKGHLVRCASEHEFPVSPHTLRAGYGNNCGDCVAIALLEALRVIVEADGAVLLAQVWTTAKAQYLCVCKNGHMTPPNANNIKTMRRVPWLDCSGHSPVMAAGGFIFQVESQEAEVLGVYVNNSTPVDVRCVFGHVRPVLPSNTQQRGFRCSACAGRDPDLAFADFKARLARLPIPITLDPSETGWHLNQQTYQAHCAESHPCLPMPNRIKNGRGGCDICANKYSDVFYVVTGPNGLKFGITSGDPRSRLNDHKRISGGGYDTTVRLWTGLRPFGRAREVELDLKDALAGRCHHALPGTKEYFLAASLPLVLRVLDKALDRKNSEV
jgi:hypothetical protein